MPIKPKSHYFFHDFFTRAWTVPKIKCPKHFLSVLRSSWDSIKARIVFVVAALFLQEELDMIENGLIRKA